jgi:hypothetical protein
MKAHEMHDPPTDMSVYIRKSTTCVDNTMLSVLFDRDDHIKLLYKIIRSSAKTFVLAE